MDYEAVYHYLQSGHLGGLGIDVAWTEPFNPEDPILKFNNVLITPHVAGVTEHAYRYMSKVWTLASILYSLSYHKFIYYIFDQVIEELMTILLAC